MKIFVKLFVGSFLFCNLGLAQQNNADKIKVLGTISAFEQSPWRSSRLTSLEKSEVMIVRIDRIIKGKETSRHIWVIYKYFSYKDALPAKAFSENTELQLTLSRDRNCDNSISKVYPQSQRDDAIAGDDASLVYLFPVSSTSKEIPMDELLPCYDLSLNGYKEVKAKE